jgi:TBCC domain-containing protein 1
MKTPILMPPSEFEVLLVPVESDEAHIRRQQLQEAQSDSNNEEEEKTLAMDDAGGESTTLVSTPGESEYCRSLADMLTLSPFHMPHDYERKAILKAERVRAIQSAMQELSVEQRAALEEEINRGFQDWLVTSGNYRQVLDLIRFEREVID